MRKVTKHNIVRQQSFSDRLLSLMTQYTNHHPTPVQVMTHPRSLARNSLQHGESVSDRAVRTDAGTGRARATCAWRWPG